MADPVIKVEQVSKKFILDHESQERYTSLRDVMARKAKGILKRKQDVPAKTSTKEEFYALKDVSFSINKGDRVGIIGRNGAGKSTLLKILSRITEPSAGRITIRGRVASLLEVGTGFHPELTGRENIFLNGAILGMTRNEIRKKFDEIVAFAEVEKFLDTPVKRYSSGMYVRLAFAVAAHLEPEILVVDEVLAVGDAQFQKKCLGKMEQVSQSEGRTVLFVSHNMSSVLSFCNLGVWLKSGQVHMTGNSVNVINSYLASQSSNQSLYWIRNSSQFSDPAFTLNRFFISRDVEPDISNTDILVDSNYNLHIEGQIEELDANLKIGFMVYNSKEEVVYTSFINGHTAEQLKFKVGINKFKIRLPVELLISDDYKICFSASIYYQRWICHPPFNCPEIYFRVIEGQSDNTFWNDREKGVFQPQNEFEKY
jgi:lipopolysaccharide transport system ATP-binding protein